MEKDYKKMFSILDNYLKDRVQDIDVSILEAVEARKNGKVFSFKEHLKGFIYAQLSALVSWKRIKDNLYIRHPRPHLPGGLRPEEGEAGGTAGHCRPGGKGRQHPGFGRGGLPPGYAPVPVLH